MYELYCKYRDKKGYKDSDVSKITGIPASTFSDWKRGRSKPNTTKLTKIADCLDTMVEYFDEPKCALVTCPECGLTYFNDVEQEVKQHELQHSAWQNAEKKFGTIYGNHPICEKIKAKNRNIRDNKSLPLEDRCNAELEVLRCLFSRSINVSGFDLRHVSYKDYVAMMLANKTYGPRLDSEIFQKLKKEFGTLPGIDSGSIYYIPNKKPQTLAAHFEGKEYTEEELEEIRQFAEFVKSKRR